MKFILVHNQARQRASQAIMNAPDGYHVMITEPKKKRGQEQKYHAMINEISDQSRFLDRKWSSEDMKRILVDQFSEEMRINGDPLKCEGHIIPSIDGQRIVQLGMQTRYFSVKEAQAFIEYLIYFASEQGIILNG